MAPEATFAVETDGFTRDCDHGPASSRRTPAKSRLRSRPSNLKISGGHTGRMLQPHNPSTRMRAPSKASAGASAQDLADVTITEVPGTPGQKPPPGQGRSSGR